MKRKREWEIALIVKQALAQKAVTQKCGITRQLLNNPEISANTPQPAVAKMIVKVLKFDRIKFYEA
ncbi:MAG: hypothetical protein K0S55_283 [Clostridia bacterium]|nr:hypothetical protein [Clostridia bacterium]